MNHDPLIVVAQLFGNLLVRFILEDRFLFRFQKSERCPELAAWLDGIYDCQIAMPMAMDKSWNDREWDAVMEHTPSYAGVAVFADGKKPPVDTWACVDSEEVFIAATGILIFDIKNVAPRKDYVPMDPEDILRWTDSLKISERRLKFEDPEITD